MDLLEVSCRNEGLTLAGVQAQVNYVSAQCLPSSESHVMSSAAKQLSGHETNQESWVKPNISFGNEKLS